MPKASQNEALDIKKKKIPKTSPRTPTIYAKVQRASSQHPRKKLPTNKPNPPKMSPRASKVLSKAERKCNPKSTKEPTTQGHQYSLDCSIEGQDTPTGA